MKHVKKEIDKGRFALLPFVSVADEVIPSDGAVLFGVDSSEQALHLFVDGAVLLEERGALDRLFKPKSVINVVLDNLEN